MKIFYNKPDLYELDKEFQTDYLSYAGFLKNKRSIFDILKHGLLSSKLHTKLTIPSFIQKLYLEKDKGYFDFLNEFYERFKDFDVIVMNPGLDLVHPEFLHKKFKNSLKCLHFIDDPHLTYSYCLPFSWAFDCATYISPSYSRDLSMKEILDLSGLKINRWVPHCITNNFYTNYGKEELIKNLEKRKNKAIYVGNFYLDKTKRLAYIKSKLKDKLHIYGRYPLEGFSFPLVSLLNGIPSLYKVNKLSNEQREKKYSQYGVGLNMHLSFPSIETGNARLYELPYRGLAQVVDISKYSLVDKIFKPKKEILTYQNLNEAVEKLNFLIENKNERIQLALNSYYRASTDYSHQKVTNEMFKWFKKIING